MSKETETKVEVLSEEDLLKAIKDLEAKPDPAKPAEPPAPPKVETVNLGKSVADTVKENASDGLRKVLDVSETLREVVGLIGTHVDDLVEPMAKSLQSGAERDLAIVRVLSDLKKSIDANTEAIKEFGNAPAEPKTPTATKKDVLNKSLGPKAAEQPIDPAKIKRQVSQGLEKLAKSFPQGSNESQEYIQAAIQFESTGKISDYMLAAAKTAMTPKAAA